MEKNLGKRYTEEFKKMIVELYIQGKTKKCLSQEWNKFKYNKRMVKTREERNKREV